ncbi:MAG: hypothetical protein ACUVRZ_09665, partial [Desulfobacca sp.]
SKILRSLRSLRMTKEEKSSPLTLTPPAGRGNEGHSGWEKIKVNVRNSLPYNREPETGNQKPETGNQKPETRNLSDSPALL